MVVCRGRGEAQRCGTVEGAGACESALHLELNIVDGEPGVTGSDGGGECRDRGTELESDEVKWEPNDASLPYSFCE